MVETFQREDWQDYELEADEGFLNANKYPNPANQIETRKQLQSQHSQLQDYVNETLVPAVNETAQDLSQNYYTKDQVYTKDEVQEEIATVTGFVTKTYVDNGDSNAVTSAGSYTDQQDNKILNGTLSFTKLSLATNHVIEATDSNGNTVSFSIELVPDPVEPEEEDE